MYDCFIRRAKLVDPNSPFNGQAVDISTRQSVIEAIAVAGNLQPTGQARVIEADGLVATPGLVDSFCHLTDPGYEYRDNLLTLSQTARESGFTDVIYFPDCNPVVDSADQLLALRHRSENMPTRFHFAGALSLGLQGKDMAPLFELHQVGAVCFTDSTLNTPSAPQLVLMLQYLQLFDGLLVVVPVDKSMVGKGVANESPNTTRLGLKGIPSLAESLAISQCLQVLAYAGGRIHFSPVTTAEGVRLIRQAKSSGLKVTASTASHYVALDDTALNGFDSNYKVMPPLRSVTDQEALIEGLLDGTIDFIASHNSPRALEEKALEYEQSDFGMLSQPIALALLHSRCAGHPNYSLDKLVEWCATNPRKLFGLPDPKIEPGQPAAFTLLQVTDEPCFPYAGRLKSKSPNIPMLGGLTNLRVVPLG